MHARWQATVQYRADHATVDATWDLEEISDLAPLIELGPHWDTIEKIEIVRVNHCTSPTLTIQQAEKM